MIRINNALKVPGYMSEEELTYLADIASMSKVIVEVGSLYGRSTVAIAENTNGIVFAVDTFSGDLETNETIDLNVYATFLQNTKGIENIVPLTRTSLSAAKLFLSLGIKADFIFLDADHNESAIKADIVEWSKVLIDGGIFSGHDYGFSNWPYVKKVVYQMVPSFNTVGTIWTTEGC